MGELVSQIVSRHIGRIAILNFAAESHVDRSIDGPSAFIETNIDGTFGLLNAALDYWRSLPDSANDVQGVPSRESFRFLACFHR